MPVTSEKQLQKLIDTASEANQDAIKRFNKEKKALGLKLLTRCNYVIALRSFTSHVNKGFDDVTKDDVVDWLSSLDLSQHTENMYKTNLKKFFQWYYGCEDDEYPDIVRWIKSKQPKKRTIDILTPDEIKRMVDVCDNQRDRALMMTLYESGCRAGEILDVKVKDVQFDQYGAICMVNGKTGGRRIRLIDATPDLRLWINMHPEKDNPDAPLWIKHRRGRGKLGYDGLFELLRKLRKEAGIKKKVHPHLLRHSRLTELAKELTDSQLKVFAGWEADSRMPGVYIHLSGADIDKKILGIHGLAEEEERVEDRPLTPKKCPRCEIDNPPTAKFCYRCSAVLDIKAALELEEAHKSPDEWLDHVLGDKEKLFNEFMEFMEFKKAREKAKISSP